MAGPSKFWGGEVCAMEIKKKRCEFCHEWFSSSPYAAHHQKSCSNPSCRKKRKAAANKKWRANNQDYEKGRNEEKRNWARRYPDYWRKYRKEHSDYTKRERRRMSSVRKMAESVARQDTVHKISVEKLESIRNFKPNSVARQDAVHRRVNGILDYLFWKESVARQDEIAILTPSG